MPVNKEEAESTCKNTKCMGYKETGNEANHTRKLIDSNEKENRLFCANCKCVENETKNNVKRRFQNRRHTIDECSELMDMKSKAMYTASRKQSLGDIAYSIIPPWLKEKEDMVVGVKEKIPHVIHNHSDSYFSTSSGFNNYRGLLNLMIILLALSNARLFLENIIKYGILISPIQWFHVFLQEPYSWPCLIILLLSNIFILVAFYTECALSKNSFSDRVGFVINVVNLTILIAFPAGVILYIHPTPLFSCPTLGIYTIVFLKLCSYACVNKWCRTQLKPGGAYRRRMHRSLSTSGFSGMSNGDVKSSRIQYPHNLTLKDLYYFMFAPTLCYELNFPRSSRIRKRFLLKRIIEMLFLSQLMAGLMQQWIVPTINNSLRPLTDMDVFRCAERLLKLAVPNHFIWLIFFYWFFHSCTNVIAELLMFGDRQFYGDWWNAETVAAFWKEWNIPVHRWAQRHLYKPLLRYGHSKRNASIAVFVVSAFFHEYLVSIPLRMFKTWAFMGMLGQVPLAIITGKYCQGQIGNFVVWLSLILGQPIAILAYVHEYYIAHAVSN